jgi:hypothetical protein
MTHAIRGTGCPRQPDTRFPSADCVVGTVLGRSCSREWFEYQRRREHLYSGNAKRGGGRPAALACIGLCSQPRTHELQNGLEIDVGTGEVRGRRQTFPLYGNAGDVPDGGASGGAFYWVFVEIGPTEYVEVRLRDYW